MNKNIHRRAKKEQKETGQDREDERRTSQGRKMIKNT
jgi:hypothetical protein